MAIKKRTTKKDKKKFSKYFCKRGNENCDCNHNNGCGGAIYGLGLIGAAIYYISTATGFWMGVLGFLKSIIWPIFLVYEVLKFVGA